MNTEEVTSSIKDHMERRLRAIEQELSHCESYSWELGRRRNMLEQEHLQLLSSLEALFESDRIYSSSEMPQATFSQSS